MALHLAQKAHHSIPYIGIRIGEGTPFVLENWEYFNFKPIFDFKYSTGRKGDCRSKSKHMPGQ